MHLLEDEYMPNEEKYLIAIHPDGRIEKNAIKKHPSLEQLRNIVGGHIELIPYFTKYEHHQCLAFCNEEGKLKDFVFNPKATNLWIEAFGKSVAPDYLVGSIAVVVGPPNFLRSM